MAAAKINIKNFKRICGLNGLTPSEVPQKLGRHRDTIYKALRRPRQFKPTMKRLENLLVIRDLPR